MKEISGEIWYKIACSGCETINFVCAGYFPDPDLSKLDVDGFKCWNCGKEFSFIEDEEPMYVEEGKPKTVV